MKKYSLSVICVVLFALLAGCGNKETSNITVDYGDSAVYTEQDMDDAIGVLKCFVECEYKKEIRIAEGMRIQFTDAGHLLGSSSIEVWIREGETEKKLVFSGDIGNTNQPLIRDPQYLDSADVIIAKGMGNFESMFEEGINPYYLFLSLIHI